MVYNGYTETEAQIRVDYLEQKLVLPERVINLK